MFSLNSHLLSRALLVGAALSVAACGIPKEQYDKDLADLNASMSKKSADDLGAAKAACDQNLADRDAAYATAKADATRKAADEFGTVKKALDDCTNKGGDSAKMSAGARM